MTSVSSADEIAPSPTPPPPFSFALITTDPRLQPRHLLDSGSRGSGDYGRQPARRSPPPRPPFAIPAAHHPIWEGRIRARSPFERCGAPASRGPLALPN